MYGRLTDFGQSYDHCEDTSSLPPCPYAPSRLASPSFLIVIQLAVVISSIYWTLLIFFPQLIIAQNIQQPGAPSSSSEAPAPFYLPLSIDLALHAAPTISLVVDFFAFESKYTEKEVRIAVPTIMAAYTLFYSSWVEFCASKNHGICECKLG